ncbi:CD109 antigen, partial [Eurytemora carolleeae]|uniref:CD109 antigen n=1 Tax=Eurytemora carolleeae TaxID=1294199 RepID=UPI000C77FD91
MLNSLTGILLVFIVILQPAAKGIRDISLDTYNIDEIDNVDNRVYNQYRSRASYLILASRIIRPSTIYQICVNAYRGSEPMRVKASLSRDGVEVSGSEEFLNELEAKSILLQVPEGTSLGYSYNLRIEGFSQDSGAVLFQNESRLEFNNRFLAVIISTNKVIYNAFHIVRVRAVLLKTDLLPYDEVVDMFILDPDGFIIRKWHSKQLNNGVVTAEFEIPEFPKVGFWKIRVVAGGQVTEKSIKVEKYYVPKFETFASMSEYTFSSETNVEVSVNHAYTFDKIGLGDCMLRWFAKAIDQATPLYNDTVHYRQEYEYYYKKQNLPVSHKLSHANETSTLFEEPWVNISESGKPFIHKTHNWTYLRTDRFVHKHSQKEKSGDLNFRISMEEIQAKMGTLI